MTSDPNLIDLKRAAAKLEEWMARRDALIYQAVVEGASLRTVAEHAGVTHQTVANIARRQQKENT